MNTLSRSQVRKRFGQHFLADDNILTQIVVSIAPQQTDHVLEIGPGRGALTRLLLPAIQQLDVVEIDRDLVNYLTQYFRHAKNLTIHAADILTFDVTTLFGQNQPMRVVGNLPYNISTPLLFKLFAHSNHIKDMYFMLQREVVMRLTAQPDTTSYGRLSIMAQYYCDCTALFNVSPQAFSPSPQVESTFVYLKPRRRCLPVKNFALFSAVVREAFSYRRKTLRNSLKNYITPPQLQALDIMPQQRPQQLTLEDFIKISNMIS